MNNLDRSKGRRPKTAALIFKMKIGIVGAEERKFTPEGKAKAVTIIRAILSKPGVTEVISGHCHLGGIDIWAEEVGEQLGLIVTAFPPASHSWLYGYMPRNLKIAHWSDVVHCITVNRLPDDYTGMRFPLCYHCQSDDHVKSGGCWTMKKARRGVLHIVNQ